MSEPARASRIPVVLLTGFLGTGKTTLLRRLLAEPALARTAVLINEVGAIGLDHQLVFGAGGAPTGDAGRGLRTALLLANGCICCTVRDDLSVALDDLCVRVARGELPAFDRVIVESTGLANPVPVIDAIATAPLTASRYALAGVVCTVDAAAPPDRLDRHRESLAQVVCADDLVVTRTDLATEDDIARLEKRLAKLNPRARILRAAHGAIDAVALLGAPDDAPRRQPLPEAARAAVVPPAARPLADLASLGPIGPRFHAGDVQAQTLRFGGPSVWSEALKTVEQSIALADAGGREVLRVKGVLRLDGHATPMVVQYAGGRISPLEPLPDALADGDAGYLVIITGGRERAAAATRPTH